jgi:hypothetical protein
MNNIRLLRIICFMLAVFLAAAIGVTVYIDGLHNDLAAKEAKLASTQQTLKSTNNLLLETKDALDVEIERTTSLKIDLNSSNNELAHANSIIEAFDGEKYKIEYAVSEQELDMLAKTVWGEARGCNRLEQSAVVWCILNRVDSGRGTIAQVITEPDQFHGYSKYFPVTDEIRELVQDVVARWVLEKYTCGNVGRTLPINYLYFSSDATGIGNVFRTEWRGPCEVWNWNCWNPYE